MQRWHCQFLEMHAPLALADPQRKGEKNGGAGVSQDHRQCRQLQPGREDLGGPSPLGMPPSPSSPSGAAALDLRPSVNTENKTVWPSLTQWGPRSQSPQGSRQSGGDQGSFISRDSPAAHPQGWLGPGCAGPALPILVVGEGETGRAPVAHFLPPGPESLPLPSM